VSRYLVQQRDGPEAEVIAYLRERGYSVAKIGGQGIPDLLVARAGRMWLLEIKRKGGKVRPSQREFIRSWPAPVWVVTTPEEALDAVTRCSDVVNGWDDAHQQQSRPRPVLSAGQDEKGT
jgi:hypothetical protein